MSKKRKPQHVTTNDGPDLIVTLAITVQWGESDTANAFTTTFADGREELVQGIYDAAQGAAMKAALNAFEDAVTEAIGGVRSPDPDKRLMPMTLSQTSRIGRA